MQCVLTVAAIDYYLQGTFAAVILFFCLSLSRDVVESHPLPALHFLASWSLHPSAGLGVRTRSPGASRSGADGCGEIGPGRWTRDIIPRRNTAVTREFGADEIAGSGCVGGWPGPYP